MSPALQAQGGAIIKPGTDGYLLEIPKLGLRRVVYELEPFVFNGRNTPLLKKHGVGQVPYHAYLKNVSPGEMGLAVITGHRTTSGGPFRNIHRLARGDVLIIRKGAAEQRWRVTSSATVPPKQVDAIRSSARSRGLAIMACDPPFSAARRLIVYAEPLE